MLRLDSASTVQRIGHLALCLLLSAVILVIDRAVPLGVAVGIGYLLVMALCWFAPWPRQIIAVAIICSVLNVAGYFTSGADIPLWIAEVNRAMVIAAIWLSVWVILQHHKMQDQTAHLTDSDRLSREAQIRLNDVLNNADAVIISVDRDHRICAFNGAAEKVFGYTAAEVLGELLELLIPERLREVHRTHVQGFAEGESTRRRMDQRGDIFGLRKDGTEFPAEAAISKVDIGAETTLTVFLLDISQRREAEAALSRLEEQQRLAAQDNAAIADIGRLVSSTLDLDDLFQQFAAELGKLVPFDRLNINFVDLENGVYRFKFISGLDWPNRNPGETFSLTGTHTDYIVTTGQTLIQNDIDPQQPFSWDARYDRLGLRSNISVPLRSRGAVFGTLNLRSKQVAAYGEREKSLVERIGLQVAPAIENATLYQQSLQLTRELEEQANELTRSNADLEQFAYAASHDLQEPLRSISGFARLLARRHLSEDDEEATDYVNRIIGAATRMQELTNALLEYARVGRNLTSLVPVDSNQVLANTITDLSESINQSNAVVTNDQLPVVLADTRTLQLVFQNLISNAIKFRGQEPSWIHVSAAQNGPEWVFSVKDNGIGIPEEFQVRIFTIFQRLHTRAQYPGSGVGLSICKKALEFMGGRIWVESEPGVGSTFYFTLPTAPVDEQFRPQNGPMSQAAIPER